jgi:hypothetical protein
LRVEKRIFDGEEDVNSDIGLHPDCTPQLLQGQTFDVRPRAYPLTRNRTIYASCNTIVQLRLILVLITNNNKLLPPYPLMVFADAARFGPARATMP